jgi:two-component SAPR family response regulator
LRPKCIRHVDCLHANIVVGMPILDQIDLLLTDVIMPGLNGPDLARRIVRLQPEIKLLYVSGFPSTLLPSRCGDRMRMAFLAKPFTPQALARKVRDCLDSRISS